VKSRADIAHDYLCASIIAGDEWLFSKCLAMADIVLAACPQPAAEPQGAVPTGGVRCWVTRDPDRYYGVLRTDEPTFNILWLSDYGPGQILDIPSSDALLGDKRGSEAIIECRIVPVSEQARDAEADRWVRIFSAYRDAGDSPTITAKSCAELATLIERLAGRGMR